MNRIQADVDGRDRDRLTYFLCELSRAVAITLGEDPEIAAIYGLNVENATFMLHPFCWCEDTAGCPWCRGCTCDPEEGSPYGCEFCEGSVRFPDKGEEPFMGAPNFWHKPSGLKVWWYKHIGRGLSVCWGDVGAEDLPRILVECERLLNLEGVD